MLVEVGFPSFRDGRGYSAARILREAGYTGELRAAGDVLVDQLPFMRRCGFDSFAPEAAIDAATLARALSRYTAVYQPAADGAVPVWRRRRGSTRPCSCPRKAPPSSCPSPPRSATSRRR